jgi:hypothetical protein
MIAAVNQHAGMLTVEQLTRGQWHVIDMAGPYNSGVPDWVTALDKALWTALLTNRGVESVDLRGERLLLLHPGCEE